MEQKVSGYKIYYAITHIAHTPCSTDKVEQMQQEWLNMERFQTKLIEDWSTRVQNAAWELSNTPICLTLSDTGRRWRMGLGADFSEFNKLIQVTSQVPAGWEEDQPLIILKERTEKYLQHESGSLLCDTNRGPENGPHWNPQQHSPPQPPVAQNQSDVYPHPRPQIPADTNNRPPHPQQHNQYHQRGNDPHHICQPPIHPDS
eukprot:279484-Ditylum_brightwellii.AAC.1